MGQCCDFFKIDELLRQVLECVVVLAMFPIVLCCVVGIGGGFDGGELGGGGGGVGGLCVETMLFL